MRLDHYRACSGREKRQVLDVFWRRGGSAPAATVAAAYEYGWWAVVSLTVIVVELGLVVAVLAMRASVWGWWVGAAEAADALALLWAMRRLRDVEAVAARSDEPGALSRVS